MAPLTIWSSRNAPRYYFLARRTPRRTGRSGLRSLSASRSRYTPAPPPHHPAAWARPDRLCQRPRAGRATAYLHRDAPLPGRIEAASLLSPFDPVVCRSPGSPGRSEGGSHEPPPPRSCRVPGSTRPAQRRGGRPGSGTADDGRMAGPRFSCRGWAWWLFADAGCRGPQIAPRRLHSPLEAYGVTSKYAKAS